MSLKGYPRCRVLCTSLSGSRFTRHFTVSRPAHAVLAVLLSVALLAACGGERQYSLWLEQDTLTVAQADSHTLTVGVSSSGATGLVALSLDPPTWLSASFDPPRINPGQRSTLRLTVAEDAALGTTKLIILAQANSVIKRELLSLRINAKTSPGNKPTPEPGKPPEPVTPEPVALTLTGTVTKIVTKVGDENYTQRGLLAGTLTAEVYYPHEATGPVRVGAGDIGLNGSFTLSLETPSEDTLRRSVHTPSVSSSCTEGTLTYSEPNARFAFFDSVGAVFVAGRVTLGTLTSRDGVIYVYADKRVRVTGDCMVVRDNIPFAGAFTETFDLTLTEGWNAVRVERDGATRERRFRSTTTTTAEEAEWLMTIEVAAIAQVEARTSLSGEVTHYTAGAAYLALPLETQAPRPVGRLAADGSFTLELAQPAKATLKPAPLDLNACSGSVSFADVDSLAVYRDVALQEQVGTLSLRADPASGVDANGHLIYSSATTDLYGGECNPAYDAINLTLVRGWNIVGLEVTPGPGSKVLTSGVPYKVTWLWNPR